LISRGRAKWEPGYAARQEKTQPQIKDKPDVVPEERREKLMQVFGRELTTDEIIRFVRDFAAQTRRHKDCRDCLYIDMALALADEVENLRRAAQESKPLTLEELRRMDGKPVWVEYRAPIKVGKPWGARSEWMLVCDEIMHGNKSCVPFSRIGIDAQAYARRPEGSENI
jgi:hypothetical protein